MILHQEYQWLNRIRLSSLATDRQNQREQWSINDKTRGSDGVTDNTNNSTETTFGFKFFSQGTIINGHTTIKCQLLGKRECLKQQPPHHSDTRYRFSQTMRSISYKSSLGFSCATYVLIDVIVQVPHPVRVYGSRLQTSRSNNTIRRGTILLPANGTSVEIVDALALLAPAIYKAAL